VRIDASGTKDEVLQLALQAIWKRQEELEWESHWPTYKKNKSYPKAEKN
jgi:hypothetical protein